MPFPFPIGQWELVALAIVVVLVFGPSRLPAIGRRLGRQTRTASEEYLELKRSLVIEQPSERDQRRRAAADRDPV